MEDPRGVAATNPRPFFWNYTESVVRGNDDETLLLKQGRDLCRKLVNFLGLEVGVHIPLRNLVYTFLKQ